MLNHRSYDPEIIDLGPAHYTVAEYDECLQKLSRVGRWLGGNAANFRALNRVSPSLESILDVGCGGGDFTILMAQHYPEAKVVGIEINPLAIDYAKRLLAAQTHPPANVIFQWRKQAELPDPPKSYDVVMATLVCHHMQDATLIDFLKKACAIAKRKVILNDLHRHPFALWSFQALATLFFRNRLVQHDGPLSVRRAFTREDWKHYLSAADISPDRYTICWQWAFRWIVEIEVNKVNTP